jgi:hypothetical protein
MQNPIIKKKWSVYLAITVIIIPLESKVLLRVKNNNNKHCKDWTDSQEMWTGSVLGAFCQGLGIVHSYCFSNQIKEH